MTFYTWFFSMWVVSLSDKQRKTLVLWTAFNTEDWVFDTIHKAMLRRIKTGRTQTVIGGVTI